jgi:nitroreductase
MNRRNFIRVAGGGIIIGAQAAWAQTVGDSEFPSDTVMAWQGPGADTRADPRRRALAYAILAPNPHNRQPWLVDLREPGVILLHCDRQRMLPHTDPLGRQILIGHGAFLELLVQALAQQGLSAQVQLFPKGVLPTTLKEWDDRPVARITVGSAGSAKPDPLFAQVLLRHTPKVDFDTTRAVSDVSIKGLVASGGLPAVAAGGTVNVASRDALRELCWASAKVELLTPRTVMESIQLTRVGSSEIRQHRDGISINTPMLRVVNALGLFDRSAPPKEGSQAYNTMMTRFEGHSKTAMGFVWLTTGSNTRADQMLAGRAYVRMQLQATAMGLGVHPMSQALQEFPEMAAHHARAHDLILGTTRQTGQTVQMLCRVGYPVKAAGATPRRVLSDFLKT